MSCILRFKGKDFDVEQVVAALSIGHDSKWKQGEPQKAGRHKFFTTSGLSFVASEADFDSFKTQVTDVISFIQANRSDLLLLGDLACSLVEGEFYFDFALTTRMFSVGVQVDFLPSELVKLCGEISAGIMLSQYPPSEEDGDDETT